MKKPRKVATIITAITLITVVFLAAYLVQTDRSLLSLAYEYNNQGLCFMIRDRDTQLRCLGVLTQDFEKCEDISDYETSACCFYGAANADYSPTRLEDLVSRITNICLKKGINETDCKTDGNSIKGLVDVNRAYRTGDSKNCPAANESSLGEGCFAILSGNDAICESSSSREGYNLCETMFYRDASECQGTTIVT